MRGVVIRAPLSSSASSSSSETKGFFSLFLVKSRAGITSGMSPAPFWCHDDFGTCVGRTLLNMKVSRCRSRLETIVIVPGATTKMTVLPQRHPTPQNFLFFLNKKNTNEKQYERFKEIIIYTTEIQYILYTNIYCKLWE